MLILMAMLSGCADEEPQAYVTCEDAWCLACRLCPDDAAAYVDCDDPPTRPDVDSWQFAMDVCGLEETGQ